MTHFTVFAALRDSNVENVTLNGKYTKQTILACLNQILFMHCWQVEIFNFTYKTKSNL